MSASRSLAVVVVRYRGGDELVHCLGSVFVHGSPFVEEVMLVDSGSGDGGARHLAARFPELHVSELADNRSFAFAANHGVERTTAPLVLLLNPDAELRAQSLASLMEHLGANPRVAGAVPLLENHDGTSQQRWQLRHLPSPARLALGQPGKPAFTAPPTGPQPVPQPAAAAWLVRREVWQRLGGLDPEFAPAWWEDVDFCQRLARTQWAGKLGFWVVPSARFVHQGGSSLATLDRGRFLAIYHRNLLRYAARHHPSQLTWIRRSVWFKLQTLALLRPRQSSAYRQAIGEVFG